MGYTATLHANVIIRRPPIKTLPVVLDGIAIPKASLTVAASSTRRQLVAERVDQKDEVVDHSYCVVASCCGHCDGRTDTGRVVGGGWRRPSRCKLQMQ